MSHDVSMQSACVDDVAICRVGCRKSHSGKKGCKCGRYFAQHSLPASVTYCGLPDRLLMVLNIEPTPHLA